MRVYTQEELQLITDAREAFALCDFGSAYNNPQASKIGATQHYNSPSWATQVCLRAFGGKWRPLLPGHSRSAS